MFERRVISNLLYFRSNYGAIALALTLYSLGSRPRSLLVLLPLALAWVYTMGVRRRPITLRGKILTPLAKVAALLPLTLLVLALTGCVFQVARLAAGCVGAILLHAALRPANIKTAFNKLGVDGVKERGVRFGWMGEEAAGAAGSSADAGEAVAAAAGTGAHVSPTAAARATAADAASAGAAVIDKGDVDAEGAAGLANGGQDDGARASLYAPVDGPKSMWDAVAAANAAHPASATTTTSRSYLGAATGSSSIYGDSPASAWHTAAEAQPVPYGQPPLTPRSELPRPSDVKAHSM